MLNVLMLMCMSLSHAYESSSVHDVRGFLRDMNVLYMDYKEFLILDYRSIGSPLNRLAKVEYEMTGKQFVILVNPHMYGWPSDKTYVLDLAYTSNLIKQIQSSQNSMHLFGLLKLKDDCREFFGQEAKQAARKSKNQRSYRVNADTREIIRD